MAGGKWIDGLKAKAPLADAARHVLGVRLGLVRDLLPPALHEAEKDPEHVHQLRVATRRARAALDIFACCLPPEDHKAATKRLRALRRAAGEARDWDVFLIDLRGRLKRPAAKLRPGLDFLAGYGLSRRREAQTALLKAGDDRRLGLDRLAADTVAAVHKPDVAAAGRTLIDLARPTLAGRVKALDEAAARDLDDYDNLHRVRIAGKRLRYAMEVFADAFAPPFKDELYPAVEEMQEILGNANDSHVAVGRLQGIRREAEVLWPEQAKRLLPGLGAVLRSHERRLPRERGRFEAWWQRWQQSGGEAALAALLKRAG